MTDFAIEIEDLWKGYRSGRRLSAVPVPYFGDRLFAGRRGFETEPLDDDEDDDELDETMVDDDESSADGAKVWALRDISLRVRPGTALGIVGAHGSGKSTLMRVLSRVTPPTSGRVVLRGRTAPSADLSSAFMEPRKSGRHNVLLLAAFFGVPRAIARERTETIFEFAGLAGLEGRAVGRLSAGQARQLAHAVALHLDPEILLADDRITGGEAAFRDRSVDFVQRRVEAGMTLVLATNDVESVRRLCSEVVWLDAGRLRALGPTEEVLARYTTETRGDAASADEPVVLGDARVLSSEGEPVETVAASELVVLEIAAETRRPDLQLTGGIGLRASDGSWLRLGQPTPFVAPESGGFTLRVELAAAALADGRHSGKIGLIARTPDGRSTSAIRLDAFRFDVVNPRDPDDETQEELPAPEAKWVVTPTPIQR